MDSRDRTGLRPAEEGRAGLGWAMLVFPIGALLLGALYGAIDLSLPGALPTPIAVAVTAYWLVSPFLAAAILLAKRKHERGTTEQGPEIHEEKEERIRQSRPRQSQDLGLKWMRVSAWDSVVETKVAVVVPAPMFPSITVATI